AIPVSSCVGVILIMANHLSNGYAVTKASPLRSLRWLCACTNGEFCQRRIRVGSHADTCDMSRIYEDSSALRRMPSFLIRLRRVLGCIFRARAAPCGPSICHRVRLRAEMMWLRSACSSVDESPREPDASSSVATVAGALVE